MVSKSQLKLITSLAQKKYRNRHGLFIVEGIKNIEEFLKSSFELQALFTTEAIFQAEKSKTFFIELSELKQISQLTTPQIALAIFQIPKPKPLFYSNLIVALDGVRDPGNLGTIIRLCDWFDVTDLVCSLDTVDCYNPKVVQSSMGSLSRVNVHFLDLKNFIQEAPKHIPVYGSFMNGNNIYKEAISSSEGILLMGNEANGISSEIGDLVTHRISIPQFGEGKTESLNVATATSIILSEFKRNIFTEK
ncbi:MAG TPA: RNA methyltransferase [Salinimicrobium sp.]|nr:RNA methyltransferase [Salinimicrobium sp.]